MSACAKMKLTSTYCVTDIILYRSSCADDICYCMEDNLLEEKKKREKLADNQTFSIRFHPALVAVVARGTVVMAVQPDTLGSSPSAAGFSLFPFSPSRSSSIHYYIVLQMLSILKRYLHTVRTTVGHP